MKRGLFIVLEGLDRSGKSSVLSAIKRWLEDHKYSAEDIHFPNRKTPIGKKIDAYLKGSLKLSDEEITSLYSQNRWEVASQIEESLRAGKCFVSVRYAFSGAAYSSAKYDPVFVEHWMREDAGLPAPDLTLYLRLSASEASSRPGFGDEVYERAWFQKRVEECFGSVRAVCEKNGGLWRDIIASGSKEEVKENVFSTLDDLKESMTKIQSQPIKYLWSHSSSQEEAKSEWADIVSQKRKKRSEQGIVENSAWEYEKEKKTYDEKK
ncbi:Thymidylate kinase like protein [Aduncisulcus paluster]|uniref:dTMP kinase n=1 Tax=Aduncisulcus paluster TaxID=2918883 RepID=A0ABQ5KV12_9EUKA|nr:Thymidylate kinase like protein [Aduncisulcus paluster]